MKHLLVVLFVFFAVVAVQGQDSLQELTATLTTADGTEIGTVSFGAVTADMVRDMGLAEDALGAGTVAIWAQVEGLAPGFHGFHIHSVGTCDPAGERAFASAGGHLHADGQTHGTHMGDLPSLYVTQSGAAVLVFMTDGFTLADLLDADGSAVIVHAGADNYGNIPTERYDPDTDETTLSTGDAGGRVACGIISVNSAS